MTASGTVTGESPGERDQGGGSRFTRRGFLASGAAAGAALALPACGGGSRPDRRVDVVIVGAGLAGLAAARRLVARGRSVVVLEARDRLGGRTHTVDERGTFLDLGGQWVGPTQTRIVALAESVGVQTFDSYATGENLARLDGRVLRGSEEAPLDDAGAAALDRAYDRLGALTEQVDRDQPWRSPRAAEWDATTLESWIDENVESSSARSFFTSEVRASAAVAPAELSLLNLISVARSGPDDEEPERWRFVGGAQQISERVGGELGERVVLAAPVERIEQSDGTVTAHSGGRRFVGDAAIVAIPMALAARIAYDPPLPAKRDQLTQHAPMASVIKCQAIYPTPFWRDDGLSGGAFSDAGPACQTADNSPPGGRPGVLVGFVAANQARRWGARSARARRTAVLAEFAALFGRQAETPLAYVEGNWPADPWSRGCYSTVLPPGVLTAFGPALRPPVGRIHWAGTETATRWTHFMDGAVRSGERAAAEIERELG